jgi:hypothetical protein
VLLPRRSQAFFDADAMALEEPPYRAAATCDPRPSSVITAACSCMPSTLIELNGGGGPSSLWETDGLDERLEGEKATPR